MEILMLTFNQGKLVWTEPVAEFPDEATSFTLPYVPNPEGKVDVYIAKDGTLKHRPSPTN